MQADAASWRRPCTCATLARIPGFSLVRLDSGACPACVVFLFFFRMGENMKAIAYLVVSAAMALAVRPAQASDEDEIKSTFERFVSAQNAHDLASVGDLLLDSPDFLWITRGTPIWGRKAALEKFDSLYKGTWKLNPDLANLKVIPLSRTSVQIFIPITFNIGAAGQPAPDMPFLMNETLVKTPSGWRIASILPIPLSTQIPATRR